LTDFSINQQVADTIGKLILDKFSQARTNSFFRDSKLQFVVVDPGTGLKNAKMASRIGELKRTSMS
jgi:hypothetical protein